MCVIEFEPCEVWTETPRKARKMHRCSCCFATIPLGEAYRAIFAVDEEGKLYEKSCGLCGAARDEFAEAHDGQSPNPSCFQSVLADCISDGDEESETRWRRR